VLPIRAGREIRGEYLLNFVANSLGNDLLIDLGENVEVMTETLYEVLPSRFVSSTP
jgi:CO dehydrogenase/acetyl-CoA synthase alpha subunit